MSHVSSRRPTRVCVNISTREYENASMSEVRVLAHARVIRYIRYM